MSETAPICFFLGANSPQGFVSRFDQLDCGDPQWHTFIIKGGPGCGKSSFMRRIAELFAPHCPSMQLIACSSDPDSLDAVILPEWKVSIADGTAPHHLGAKAARSERKPAVLRQLSGPFAADGTRRHYPQHLPSHCQKLCASHRLPVCCQKLFKRLPPDCTELPAKRKAGSLCPPFFLQAFSPQIPARQRRGAFSNLYQCQGHHQPCRYLPQTLPGCLLHLRPGGCGFLPVFECIAQPCAGKWSRRHQLYVSSGSTQPHRPPAHPRLWSGTVDRKSIPRFFFPRTRPAHPRQAVFGGRRDALF